MTLLPEEVLEATILYNIDNFSKLHGLEVLQAGPNNADRGEGAGNRCIRKPGSMRDERAARLATGPCLEKPAFKTKGLGRDSDGFLVWVLTRMVLLSSEYYTRER
jgi:hypothetical protein